MMKKIFLIIILLFPALVFATWKSTMSQDANSTYTDSALGVGEIEVMFYNSGKTAQAQDLSGYTWRDLDGNIATFYK